MRSAREVIALYASLMLEQWLDAHVLPDFDDPAMTLIENFHDDVVGIPIESDVMTWL